MQNSLLTKLVLVIVAGTSQASQGRTTCTWHDLEAFPAEYVAKEVKAELQFLAETPVRLNVEKIEKNPSSRRISLHLSAHSGENLAKLTNRYIDKHLALVVDGKIVSVPRIRSKIDQTNFDLTFPKHSQYEAFLKLMEAKQDCQ